MTNNNLWDKDKKTVFRELYHQYLEEGYNQKEAKRMAKEESEEIYSDQVGFAFGVVEKEYEND
jgi:hypothetical protein